MCIPTPIPKICNNTPLVSSTVMLLVLRHQKNADLLVLSDFMTIAIGITTAVGDVQKS